MRPNHLVAVLIATVLTCLGAGVAAASEPNFESPPVHPVDLSPNGEMLFVAHTADHRLVVFDLTGPAPTRVLEIMVGIEPVTARARTNDEVWVVNHVSDDISIVDVTTGNVARTLLVGDEPTDVVFANGKAFVSVSQEDMIRVYDLGNLDFPPAEVALDASDPRSLAVSTDSSTVFVTALEGGNRTTCIPATTVSALGGLPAPSPPMDGGLPSAPAVGLIVQHDGTNWVDENGGMWNAAVPYQVLDNDVLAISTAAPHAVTAAFEGVGTTIFNVAVHPGGDLYVSAQEAFNLTRFEPNLNGRFAENWVTRVNPTGGTVTPAHLNSHINYNDPAGNASERAASLAIPLDISIASTGDIYVAAFGSRKVGVLDAAGNVTRRIDVGAGPAGIAVDELRSALYVYNRFSSTLSVVDLFDDSSIELSLGFDPSPQHVRDGRKFLYEGEISSAHGDLSCATCHVFGGIDNIAWDLGDPGGEMTPVPAGQLPQLPDFHPMKGPMTTQSLKALAGTEPLHWRGDRADFAAFNGAFASLLGLQELSPGDFQTFEDFVFTMRYPSNPFRELDGSLPPSLNGADPSNGKTLFETGQLVGGADCVSCHALPTGENGAIIPGAALLEPEGKVVPQLRNMYEKTRFDNTTTTTVRGFGFTHDGAVDDLFTFLEFPAFNFNTDDDQRDVEAFLLAFDTGTHAAVGAQLTTNGPLAPDMQTRLNTLEGLADTDVIGLVAKGRVAGQPRGWTYMGAGMYRPDKDDETDLSQASVVALAGAGTEITFTGVVDGCEWRLGVDRDNDGFRDGDEVDAGSDPGDPESTPETVVSGVGDRPARAPSALWMAGANPVDDVARLGYQVGVSGPVHMDVFDVRGRLVARLVDDPARNPGAYAQTWNLTDRRGQNVASGVYFVRMTAIDAVRVQRLTVVR